MNFTIKIITALILFAAGSFTYSQHGDTLSSADVHDSLNIDYNYINSIPQNAEIYINDELIGNTPQFFMWSDSVFPKQVKVKMKGYAEYSETVNDAVQLKKTYTLVSLSGSRLPVLVKQDRSPHFHAPRKIAPIVLSGLVTAGAGFAAFWYKSLAIENRDHYNEFNDQESLDKKKKYDIISGVSIAAFQLGFGALMYFLFID